MFNKMYNFPAVLIWWKTEKIHTDILAHAHSGEASIQIIPINKNSKKGFPHSQINKIALLSLLSLIICVSIPVCVCFHACVQMLQNPNNQSFIQETSDKFSYF